MKWHWLTKWFIKEEAPGEFKQIHSIQGELTPGMLTLAVHTVDQDGNHLHYPMDNLELKITPRLRAVVNRVLLELETDNDMEVLNQLARKNLK